MAQDEVKVKFSADTSSYKVGVKEAERATEGLAGSVLNLGKVLAGLAAARQMYSFLKESVAEAAQAEQVYSRLQASVLATGTSFLQNESKIKQFAETLASTTRYGDTETYEVLKNLTEYTGSLGSAMKGASIVFDLAIAKNMDLNSASRLVGMAMTGNVEMLGRFIPELRNLDEVLGKNATSVQKAEYAMKIMSEKFGGAAKKDLETYAGKVADLTGKWQQFKENLGTQLLPMLGQLTSKANILVEALNQIGVAKPSLAVKGLRGLGITNIPEFLKKELPTEARLFGKLDIEQQKSMIDEIYNYAFALERKKDIIYKKFPGDVEKEIGKARMALSNALRTAVTEGIEKGVAEAADLKVIKEKKEREKELEGKKKALEEISIEEKKAHQQYLAWLEEEEELLYERREKDKILREDEIKRANDFAKTEIERWNEMFDTTVQQNELEIENWEKRMQAYKDEQEQEKENEYLREKYKNKERQDNENIANAKTQQQIREIEMIMETTDYLQSLVAAFKSKDPWAIGKLVLGGIIKLIKWTTPAGPVIEAGEIIDGTAGGASAFAHKGGIVRGTGRGDRVPAMLEPGEEVIPRGEVGQNRIQININAPILTDSDAVLATILEKSMLAYKRKTGRQLSFV